MFCPVCGNQLKETDKFCNECGWKVVSLDRMGVAGSDSELPSLRRSGNQLTSTNRQQSNANRHTQIAPRNENSSARSSTSAGSRGEAKKNGTVLIVAGALVVMLALGRLVAMISVVSDSLSEEQKEASMELDKSAAESEGPIHITAKSPTSEITESKEFDDGFTESKEQETDTTEKPLVVEGKLTEPAIDALAAQGVIFVESEKLKIYKEYLEEKKVFATLTVDYGGSSQNYVYAEDGQSYYFDENEYKYTDNWNDVTMCVIGTVSDGRVNDCEILSTSSAEIEYANSYIDRMLYKQDLAQMVHDDIVTQASQFKDDCVDVSWDDLRRNPDSYKGDKIKVKVKFVQVDADGWIFQGTQVAKMDGNNDHMIAITDKRVVRLPRFVEGDSITLYGYGNGLSTLKSAGAGGKLSDFWSGEKGTEVPDIDVQYTANDNYDDWIKAIDSGNTDYHIAR